MSKTWKETRESIIKDNPLCKKCGESTTNMNSELINIGTENVPGVLQAQWYSEHKNCPRNKKRWTRNKED
jgi:hypothetical protein